MSEEFHEVFEQNKVVIDESVRGDLAASLKQTFITERMSDGSNLLIARDLGKCQSMVDEVYSSDYQRRKLATASLDPSGRPVRYYRQVSLDILLNILKLGSETALTHHSEPYSIHDEALEAMANYVLRKRDVHAQLKSVPESLYQIFSPMGKSAIDESFGVNGYATDWSKVLGFIETHLQPDELKAIHATAYNACGIIRYSPYLSVCPGGPRIYPPPNTSTLLELVIPDDEVKINEMNKHKLEREVLVRRIDASSISRIIFGEKTFRQLIVHNPESPVGNYILNHSDLPTYTAHANWLTQTPIGDTMPVEPIAY
jgi:hypothetical protein